MWTSPIGLFDHRFDHCKTSLGFHSTGTVKPGTHPKPPKTKSWNLKNRRYFVQGISFFFKGGGQKTFRFESPTESNWIHSTSCRSTGSCELYPWYWAETGGGTLGFLEVIGGGHQMLFFEVPEVMFFFFFQMEKAGCDGRNRFEVLVSTFVFLLKSKREWYDVVRLYYDMMLGVSSWVGSFGIFGVSLKGRHPCAEQTTGEVKQMQV